MVNASFTFGKYFVEAHDFDHGILAHPRTRVGVAALTLSLTGARGIADVILNPRPAGPRETPSIG